MIKFFLKKEVYGFIVIVILGFILTALSKAIIDKVLLKHKDTHKIRRAKTYVILFERLAKIIIWVFVLIALLQLYGFDVKAFVTGLGIVSVIIGLALQDTLKDILGGITIISDDFYAIGDYITYDNFTGEVIDLSLRTTKIKNFNNEVKCFTNRNVSSVVNHSKNKYICFLDFAVSYEDDVEKVEKSFLKIVQKIKKMDKVSEEDVFYLGINKLDNSCVCYRIQIASKYVDQFIIRRKINEIVKNEFDSEQIKIPYPQIEVHDARIF